jgi:hypothetical protein
MKKDQTTLLFVFYPEPLLLAHDPFSLLWYAQVVGCRVAWALGLARRGGVAMG